MAGPSDKARFYMEQAVPQLQDFEQKKIFTKEEIKNLVKKRSSHEHKVLARGSQPTDFARYAAWELNLEQLRQKRCKRMRIKGSSAHVGQARVFQIYDRATKKHPGDIALYMSYLEYARQVKATNKFKAILASALRLHPTKPQLWLYAAKWTLEVETDMNGARSYLQRGTRFCTMTGDLWIEYARLEMSYLAKIALRRRFLGLNSDEDLRSNNQVVNVTEEKPFDHTAAVLTFSELGSSTLGAKAVAKIEVDSEATKNPMNTPVLNGAIPLAIFEAARKQPFFGAAAAEMFFNMFATFTQVRCLPKVLQHVIDVMMESYDDEAATWSCYLRMPLVGLHTSSAAFPAALRVSLDRLTVAIEKSKDKMQFGKRIQAWIEHLLASDKLDPGIRTVLEHMLRKAVY